MTPIERKKKLKSIDLQQASYHHDWLRTCFKEELEYRLGNAPKTHYQEGCGDFENIYHCATLLYYINDKADIKLFCRAKCSKDMDLGTGFDWQFLFMDTPENLIKQLSSLDDKHTIACIREYEGAYQEDFDTPQKRAAWFKDKCTYYNIT